MIGDTYKSAAIQAVLGPAHSDVIPDVLWGAWLDDEHTVLATTGNPVPHDWFEGIEDGVTNTTIVDCGAAPSTIGDAAFFALLDAETDGVIVAYVAVTFDSTPAEDDPVAFDAGELTFTYVEP